MKKIFVIMFLAAALLVALASASCGGASGPSGGTEPDDGTLSSGADGTVTYETTSGPDADGLYKQTVRIHRGGVDKTIENLPLLLEVSDADFLSRCSPRLEDLRIYDAAGKELAYEIDGYAAGSGAYIWVAIPSVSPEADTILTLSCGGAVDPEPGFSGVRVSEVWEGWELVLHMSGAGGASLYDSSPNKYKLTGGLTATSPGLAAGIIGTSADFNGVSDALTVEKSFTPPGSPAVTVNSYADTGYIKPTSWEYAQGLTTDGTYFYFAGHHDKTNEGASIHKIRISDMSEAAVFEKTGPLHGAELAYAADRGTILACTGGNGRAAAVWELSRDDGKSLSKWDFAKVGYGGAALVAYCGGGEIILFTSIEDGAKYALDRIKLGDDGSFTVLGSWKHGSGEDLGVPQGLEYRDGYVYLLADAGASVSVDPHYIYKLEIAPSSERPEIVERYSISINRETEGLCFASDGTVYFGTNEEKIYRMGEAYGRLNPHAVPSDSARNQSFTVFCWVYVDTAPNKYPNILGFGAASGSQNALALHIMGDTGALRFGTTIGGVWTRLDSSADALSYGVWHSVAATYDGAVMKLYIDGKPAGQLDAPGALTDRGGPFSIGADIENGALSYFFDGKIDEVRFTKRVLGGEEISIMHKNIAEGLFVFDK